VSGKFWGRRPHGEDLPLEAFIADDTALLVADCWSWVGRVGLFDATVTPAVVTSPPIPSLYIGLYMNFYSAYSGVSFAWVAMWAWLERCGDFGVILHFITGWGRW